MNEDDNLREKLREMLASGLQTDSENRAYDTDKFEEIVARLQPLAPVDYEQKLVIAGFTDHPYIDAQGVSERCENCVHFLTHEKHCEVPELEVPVEPEWCCVLWRI